MHCKVKQKEDTKHMDLLWDTYLSHLEVSPHFFDCLFIFLLSHVHYKMIKKYNVGKPGIHFYNETLNLKKKYFEFQNLLKGVPTVPF